MTDTDREIAAAAVQLALAAAESNSLTDQTRPTSKRDLRTAEERTADDAIVAAAMLRLRLS